MVIMRYLFISMLVPLFLTFLVSCQNKRQESNDIATNKDTVNAEAIKQYVREKGSAIAQKSQKVLAGQLKSAIQEGGVSKALKYCNIHAYPLIDSLDDKFDVQIKRASHRLRNPKDAPDEHEEKILNDFLQKLNNDQQPEPVVKDLSGQKMLYAKPIMLNNPLCLNCHGEVGKQLSRKNFELIKELYPEDNAHGHKLGDMRGIWSIKFDKEDVKKKLEQDRG